MLDINLLREKPEVVREALRVRQMDGSLVETVLQLDLNRRALLSKVEVMKAERNNVSKEIGRMKEPAERQAKIDAMRELG
ncbi:MAG: serine--tRNA ligase, partial [Bellilinea sp.]